MSMETQKTTGAEVPKLEYNLAGGLLLTIREEDFKELLGGLTKAGYQSGCILPFRALMESGVDQIKRSPLQIVHIEEAWNPTAEDNLTKSVLAGLIGHWKRYRGDTSEPPILQDSFFPSETTCDRLFREITEAFPEVKFISHEIDVDFPDDRLLVEINQGINLSSEEILAKAKERGFGLVFDPKHLLPSRRVISQPGLPTRPLQGEWERQFKTFSDGIKVVDINPSSGNEVSDLLAGKGILKEVAEAAKEIEVSSLRVEVVISPFQQLPGSPFHEKGFRFLEEVGQALRG